MNQSIANPILNSPFEEPERHFRFEDNTLTNTVIEERRVSAYFVPIAQPKKKGQKQEVLFEEELQENEEINRIRERVRLWREGGYPLTTKVTQTLLAHWLNPERERRLLFCQQEAVETLIYITEAARHFKDDWIMQRLTEYAEQYNAGLFRIAMKMATGSGKTLVMAMLIAWQTLNKHARPKDPRFTDRFLVVTPGITIRDRLRVLLPSDSTNYYRQFDLVPSWEFSKLGSATIEITNYHAFLLRETLAASTTTKEILTQGETDRFKETPEQMVNRVCRQFGSKGNVIVLNDEAHHCYAEKPDVKEKLSREDRKEAKRRNEDGRVWISGLQAIQKKLGIKAVYDLSATPFFLAGSGYGEGKLFPWVVSDFSLIDAIEAGIVKVPRVPVSDDSMIGEMPTYRALYAEVKDDLPDARDKDALENTQPHYPARSKPPCTVFTHITRGSTDSGRPIPTPKQPDARRRYSSSSATTQPFPRWSSTTSPAGKSRSVMEPWCRRASSTSSATMTTAGSGCIVRTQFWWTPHNSNPVRR